MITEATNMILKCPDDTLEGIAERSLYELQNRKNKKHLVKMKSLIEHLLGELEHDLA
ncbi:hypothetical protein GCM10011607_12780 [Shewanella inventionis]|uniref:Uncharacterized protein n=1 Tax=Shewanella inventionis TaxID=1738770 RepID=A0ABQ1IZP4_9GAMM|nr:hypothetical protein [Shewanella inventionis]GGB53645.1 hypothetical protein GCM10011607_12780 [Shewanella inventionis]